MRNFLFLSLLFFGSWASAASWWMPPLSSETKILGVTVLVHGLNTNPLRMTAIGQELQKSGQKVLMVGLTGHAPGEEKIFGHITHQVWIDDLTQAIAVATAVADAKHLKLNYFGYSLGAVLGLEMMGAHGVHFDRVAFLAPAFRVRPWSKLILLLEPLGGDFVVPSKANDDYRAQAGTTMAAYEALFVGIHNLQDMDLKTADVPTVIFIDPQDTLVSPSGVADFVREKQLRQWSITNISSSQGTAPRTYHHLVIDEPTLGTDEWKRMTGKLHEFFGR